MYSHNSRGNAFLKTIATVLFVVLITALYLPTVAALAPTHDISRVLAPTPALLDTSSEASEFDRAGDGDGCPLTKAIWVYSLPFNLERKRFEATFHTDQTILDHTWNIFDAKLKKYETKSRNFILAKLGIISKDLRLHQWALPCFTSGDQDLRVSYTGVGRRQANVVVDCYAGFSAARDTAGSTIADKKSFHDYLELHLGDADKIARTDHYHSEQAMLAYLYLDATTCLAKGMTSNECKLGRSLGLNAPDQGVVPPPQLQVDAARLKGTPFGDRGYQIDVCSIKAFVLDMISIPNSVCVHCNNGLAHVLFLEKYKEAIQAHCGHVPAVKLVTRISSLSVYEDKVAKAEEKKDDGVEETKGEGGGGKPNQFVKMCGAHISCEMLAKPARQQLDVNLMLKKENMLIMHMLPATRKGRIYEKKALEGEGCAKFFGHYLGFAKPGGSTKPKSEGPEAFF